jgi:pimeloyl-ACP methyl ester carboxylesterase
VTDEFDVRLPDGRTLHGYDTGDGELTVLWHHGTPNLGAPPRPLFADGIRWVSYDRPGYGGSTPRPGRDIGSAAADTAAIADARGLGRFAVVGHSGGSPHALACAALLPGRVTAVLAISGPAPFGADGLDWFAGMAPSSEASLRAAVAGRAAKERYEAEPGESEPGFVPADWAALGGDWSWFGTVVAPAIAAGPAALIDDDLAYVAPWGFDPGDVAAPLMLLHGGDDLMVPASHSSWLAERCPSAQVRIVAGEGHISVLHHAPEALDWLRSVSA